MPVQILTSDEVIDLPLSSRPLTGLPFHALKPDEFMRLLALQFTMGLKNQGSVATYWDTKHFGKPLPLTPWPCWSPTCVWLLTGARPIARIW